MTVTTRHPRVKPPLDVALRLAGAALLGIAWLLADWLAQIMPPGVAEPVPTFARLPAMAMFFAGTSSTTLLLLGGHILDRVRISARWVQEATDLPD